MQGRKRDTDIENELVDMAGGEGEAGKNRERSTDILTLPEVKCVTGSRCIAYRELSLVLCDAPDGWDGKMRGRLQREGTDVYLRLIHVAIQQKPTQHCEAIILQFKRKRI